MSSKAEKDKLKQLQEKCQSELHTLLRDEDNKYCVDCDSKGPRWASWNLGVFLCIRCAGIHRNLGVHISKVKSVNLDTWTPEQVVSLQQMGNSRARAVYEANLPDKFRRPQNDSALETFIRAKYEHKKYIAREWVPPTLPEVNWEKEIDEEIEKQKRKKKTVVERMPLGAVEVPQLPKPKHASPKPGRVAAVATVQPPPQQENKLNTDLLGLQNGDDTFSSFLSAPVQPSTAEKKVEEKIVDPAKSEEESFFNQTAPTEKEKAKLTKDSILALYGNAPVNNFTPPTSNFTPPTSNFPPHTSNFPPPTTNFPSQPNNYSAPTAFNPPSNSFPQSTNFNPTSFNNFPAQQPQQTFSNFTQFPQQNYPQQFTNQFPNQFNPIPQQTIPPSTNYQFNSQFNPPMQSAQFPINQFPQSSFQSQPQQQQQQPPNPFFNQPNLQQQFGSLTLNGPYAPTAPPKVATNIWQ